MAVPLIAVAAGAATSALIGGGVLGALAATGAALVVSQIGAAIFRPKAPSAAAPAFTAAAEIGPGSGFDPRTPGAGRTQSFRQPITEHQIVFGRCRISGPVVFLHSATDDENRADGFSYVVVVLAAHRIRAIGEVFLNGVPETDVRFAGLLRIDRALGDPAQAANANLVAETGGKWTTAHRGKGRAYLAVRIKLRPEAFPAGVPSLSAIVEGANTILDPRTGATGWSDNPALCLAWYLTAPFGWRAAWADIDLPALMAAANICDEINRHVFDAPNFELRQAGSNIAIPFLNQTSGSAIIARNMRMEACSPLAARHTAGAQDCEYDIAWTNTYLVGIDYTATANRCGNAVINRHRAPASRFQRFLAGVPNTRAAAFRQSATEVGVEGLITIATSTTTATFMADFCFNGLTDLTPTDRAVTLAANRGLGWMLDTFQAKEFALAHWLTISAAGGRLFVRVFDINGNVRLNQPGDVLASITTMQWDSNSRGWNAGAPMDDANLNRRQTIRVGPAVGYAQVGVIGFDGPIDLQSLRLYGLPEAAPAVLNGTPLLPQSGQREFAAEVSWDLPNLAPGAASLIDVTVSGARQGDLATASLVSSTRFIELDAAVWSNNTVRVMARNIAGATFDLAAATLSVGVVKRRIP